MRGPDNKRVGRWEARVVRPMTRHLIAGAAALAILGLGFLAWNALVPRERDTPVFVPVPEQESPEPSRKMVEEGTAPPELLEDESECIPVAAPDLPPLDESDDFVLAQADACVAALFSGSPNGTPDVPEDLLRRVTALVENAARGELSRGRLELIEAPAGEFRVEQRGDRYYIDARTFRRYDAVVDVLTCVPPDRLAALVRLLRPLLTQALRELGFPDADVSTVLDNAFREILAVPIPQLPIEVVRTDRAYAYAHAKLEAASPLSKQLVRLGPDNLDRLQRHVQELRSLLRGPEPACAVELP